jgi:AraC-like DNA-binding protein
MWLTDFAAFIISISFEESERTAYYLVIASISINFLFANYLVYRGLRQPYTFSGIKVPGKYSGSKITEDKSKKMISQLKDLMQSTKPYLNPDLTIKDLSEQFNIHHKFLSQVINSQFGKNFYDFVNHYRIEEAKEIMTETSDEKMTILEILYKVGFNSKSAFNNAFKKNTGKTPSEFKKTG